jgi:hypothetical protein
LRHPLRLLCRCLVAAWWCMCLLCIFHRHPRALRDGCGIRRAAMHAYARLYVSLALGALLRCRPFVRTRWRVPPLDKQVAALLVTLTRGSAVAAGGALPALAAPHRCYCPPQWLFWAFSCKQFPAWALAPVVSQSLSDQRVDAAVVGCREQECKHAPSAAVPVVTCVARAVLLGAMLLLFVAMLCGLCLGAFHIGGCPGLATGHPLFKPAHTLCCLPWRAANPVPSLAVPCCHYLWSPAGTTPDWARAV